MVLLLLETAVVSSLLTRWDRQDVDPESLNNRGKIGFLMLCCSFLTVARLGPCRTRARSCSHGTRLSGTVQSTWDGPSRGCTGPWHDNCEALPLVVLPGGNHEIFAVNITINRRGSNDTGSHRGTLEAGGVDIELQIKISWR